MDDYYTLLEIDRKASEDEIKKAYRKMAMKYHPDRNKDNPEAEDQFKKISEAYAVLSDKKKKQQYDSFGAEGFRQKFSQEDIFRDFDANEMFRNFGVRFGGSDPFQGIHEMFSGGGRFGNSFEDILGGQGFGAGGRPQSRNGGDLESNLTITLEDAVLGTEKRITIQKNDVREETVIKIPPGIEDGKKLRLKGKGSPSQFGGSPGDLYIKIDVEPHPIFQRKGNDIEMDLEINISDTLLGTTREVPTLTGPKNLKIPPRTHSHSKLRMKGFGAPKGSKGGKGDQLVRILIKFPKELTDEQRECVETLKSLGL
ncbi:MAG: integrase [Nitrospinaceae bacterium]|nr:MAG: integrase [Nitrospinaceae bacterium]